MNLWFFLFLFFSTPSVTKAKGLEDFLSSNSLKEISDSDLAVIVDQRTKRIDDTLKQLRPYIEQKKLITEESVENLPILNKDTVLLILEKAKRDAQKGGVSLDDIFEKIFKKHPNLKESFKSFFETIN